jgi:hypothetical protein
MTNELIPPPDLDHPLPDGLSHAQLVSLWLDILEASDQMLLAGIRSTLPPGGDVRAIYRAWLEEYNREHFEMLERMAERFNRVQGRYDRPSSS